jgi:hypothetical protein
VDRHEGWGLNAWLFLIGVGRLFSS